MALTKLRASSQLLPGSISESLIDTAFGAKITGFDTEIVKINGSTAVSGSIAEKVDTAVNALIGGAPGTLDTLNELAAALAADPDFSGTITSELALKATIVDLTAETTARVAIEGLLANLTTTEQGTLVGAINETQTDINTVASDLSNEISRAGSAENANTTAIGVTNGNVGTLASLTTTATSSIVAAINEVDGLLTTASSAGTTNATNIATNVTNIATNASAIATNVTNIGTNATNIATNATAITAAEGVSGTLASLTTTVKSSLVAALNEVDANADAAIASAATNATNIATNVTNIATNATDITSAEGRLTTIETDNTIIRESDLVKGEGVVGTKNDINTAFTIANAARVGTIELFINGLANFAPANFTVAGDNLTLTLSEAPSAADVVVASYVAI